MRDEGKRDRVDDPEGEGTEDIAESDRAPLRKGVTLAVGAARGSASGGMKGSAAATRGGVALAEAAVRVTYWPAQLCVLAAIALQVRLPGKLTVGAAWTPPPVEGALSFGLVT